MTRPFIPDDSPARLGSLRVLLAARAVVHAGLAVEPFAKAGFPPAPEPA